MPRKRNPAAVRVLEDLQQEEREGQGNPPITEEMVIENLRDNLLQKALRRLSPSEMIEGVGAAMPMVEKEVAELVERTNVTDPEQWSRYEAPLIRVQIARVCEQIETVFARRGWDLPELPVVGTLSTGQVASQVQAAADDTLVVLIDNGFFKFAGVMSQLFLFSDMEARTAGTFSESTLQALADLVSTHAFLRSCLYMFPRTSPQGLAATVDLLQHAVTVFVIAHEYAHIAAADVCANRSDGAEADGIGLRAREFEADRKAALTVVEVTDAEAREQGLGEAGRGIMAPFIFLAGLDILTRAEDAVAGRTPVMETSSPEAYPTCYERAEALLTLCASDPELQPVAHHADIAAASYLRLFQIYQRMHPLVVEAGKDYGPLDPRQFGTPVNPGYTTLSVIGDFWDRVWALFTGGERGDTIRKKAGTMIDVMRAAGVDVSDLEELMGDAGSGPEDRP